MADKKSRPEKERKYKEEKRDDTVATLDTSEEPARPDVDFDEDRLAVRPDLAERLDVFREGNLEGLQKDAEKFGPDGTGVIKDNLGNDIARHDGPGIADIFKSGNKYGLTGTDDVDPLTGQPQIPDDDGAPDTPFRKNDPSLVSADGGWRQQGGAYLEGKMGGGSGGGAPDGGTPTPQGGAAPGGSSQGTLEQLAGRELLNTAAGGLRKAGLHKEASELEGKANPAAKAAADKKAADDKAAADKKAADDKAAADKKAADDKAAADKKAADEKAGGKKPGEKKDGEKEGDDDETYTTGEVESTPMIGTLESGPLLTDHDLLGHRVDPGDETVFEIDKSQIGAVIKEHTTHGTQILTSAEELPAHVDLSTPPTVPGSELENTGNPLDPNAPPPLPQGGSTTGPPSGGGEHELAASTAAGEAVVLDAGTTGAPAVPAGTDFAEPPPGAPGAAPAPGGADLGQDPDDDGIPGPG